MTDIKQIAEGLSETQQGGLFYPNGKYSEVRTTRSLIARGLMAHGGRLTSKGRQVRTYLLEKENG